MRGIKTVVHGLLRWSKQDGQKKDVYFFCYDSKKERGVARQTA